MRFYHYVNRPADIGRVEDARVPLAKGAVVQGVVRSDLPQVYEQPLPSFNYLGSLSSSIIRSS